MNMTTLDLTMLYVEDDEDTRKSFTKLFQTQVSKLYVAKDAFEALEIFKKEKIHFIISDYQMPQMNGNELCQKIKEIHPHIPFILLTAFNDTELLIEAIDAGVDKFLQKPIQATMLKNTFKHLSEKFSKEFQLEKSSVCLKEAERIALLSYWDVNLTTKEINFSDETFKLFNISPRSREEKSYKELSKKVVHKDKKSFFRLFEKDIFNKEDISFIFSIEINKNIKYIQVTTKYWESSSCGKEHIVGIFQDVSHYEIQNRRLKKESNLDPTLKIFNKKYLFNQLSHFVQSSKRYGHALSVIFFDIDNFKRLNDLYGHLVADDILLELVVLIKKNIRSSDIFGRWGGDEFVIITPYSSSDSTIDMAEKIRAQISQQIWKDKINFTISIGLSFYEHGDNIQSLLKRADIKMLEAKHQGKNRYVF